MRTNERRVVQLFEQLFMLTVGSIVGFITAWLYLKRFSDISPQRYKEALKAQEEVIYQYKRVINQLKGRLRVAEMGISPNEVTNFPLDKIMAGDLSALQELLNNVKLPKILQPLKPFLPAILNKIQENPEVVKQIVEKIKAKTPTSQAEGI